MIHKSSLILSLFCIIGCKPRAANQQSANVKEIKTSDIEIDSEIGESLHNNEAAATDQILAAISASIKIEDKNNSLHPPGPIARRDAHPKAHGCVDAKFKILKVEPQLTSILQKGVFSNPDQEFDATIRFSNGNGNPNRHDARGDGRGMAVKVHGVSGARLTNGDDGATDTQDFVMINHPLFFVNDPEHYVPIVKGIAEDTVEAKARLAKILIGNPRETKVIAEITSIHILNPLFEQYWSEVPYQIGTKSSGAKAVKFSSFPVNCKTGVALPIVRPKFFEVPKLLTKDFNYLRNEMINTLKPDGKNSVCYDFAIQLRSTNPSTGKPEDEKDLEDPTILWNGQFHSIARITIPPQQFNSDDQNLQCENRSYSPWNGIAEHKPLGVVNRIRKVVYQAISKKRHQLNGSAR